MDGAMLEPIAEVIRLEHGLRRACTRPDASCTPRLARSPRGITHPCTIYLSGPSAVAQIGTRGAFIIVRGTTK